MMRNVILQSEIVPGGPLGRPYRVVLCALPNNPVTPLVTWLQMHDSASFFYGHYHNNNLEALSEYVERCRKHGVDWEAPMG